MRLRTDSWYWAGIRRAVSLGTIEDPRNEASWDADYQQAWDSTPQAELADVWRSGGFEGSQFGGYVLTCPLTSCKQAVHPWWHAWDCPAGKSLTGECTRGVGRQSCWDWSGSPEDGTLTAQPSLHVMAEKGGCGFHGFLTNGVLA